MVCAKPRPRLRVKCARGHARVFRQSWPASFCAETAPRRRRRPARCRGADVHRSTRFLRRQAGGGGRPGDRSTGDGSGRSGMAAVRLAGRGRPSEFGVLRRHVVLVELHLEPEAGEAGAAVAKFRSSCHLVPTRSAKRTLRTWNLFFRFFSKAIKIRRRLRLLVDHPLHVVIDACALSLTGGQAIICSGSDHMPLLIQII